MDNCNLAPLTAPSVAIGRWLDPGAPSQVIGAVCQCSGFTRDGAAGYPFIKFIARPSPKSAPSQVYIGSFQHYNRRCPPATVRTAGSIGHPWSPRQRAGNCSLSLVCLEVSVGYRPSFLPMTHTYLSFRNILSGLTKQHSASRASRGQPHRGLPVRAPQAVVLRVELRACRV
jgi:hypothetical protein